MADSADTVLTKAEESLAGAELEFTNHWYNNCANRCYYASFQAAIAALIREGIGPTGPSLQWGHDFVQAQFNGRLINARKVYPADLRDVLGRNRWLRGVADYKSDTVSEVQAARAITRTSSLLAAIRLGGGPR